MNPGSADVISCDAGGPARVVFVYVVLSIPSQMDAAIVHRLRQETPGVVKRQVKQKQHTRGVSQGPSGYDASRGGGQEYLKIGSDKPFSSLFVRISPLFPSYSAQMGGWSFPRLLRYHEHTWCLCVPSDCER